MQVFFKFIWAQIVNFFKAELLDLCKSAFKKGMNAFKEAVWAELKDDVNASIKAAIGHVEVYFHSTEARVKEEAILDTLLEWIKLPLLVRPFKKLIKNIIRDKVNALVEKTIADAKEKLVF